MLTKRTETHYRRWQEATVALLADIPEAGPELLADVVSATAEIIRQFPALVATLRAEGGWTWEEIADALGISRQAAQQRFGAR